MPMFLKDHALVTYFSDMGNGPIRDCVHDLPAYIKNGPGKTMRNWQFERENYHLMSFNVYKNQTFSP